jgi:hypothetical protein
VVYFFTAGCASEQVIVVAPSNNLDATVPAANPDEKLMVFAVLVKLDNIASNSSKMDNCVFEIRDDGNNHPNFSTPSLTSSKIVDDVAHPNKHIQKKTNTLVV